jgi:uncharacterized SAM-binding protein YcdF (DUF218 family)
VKRLPNVHFRLPQILFAAAFVVLGTIFAVLLVGYGFVAMGCFFIALLILLFDFLHQGGYRRLRNCLIGVLAVGCALFLFIEIPIVTSARSDKGEARYLIVLGAGVNGTTPSLSLLNRLEAALHYLVTYPDCTAVVTGAQGDGEDISEAQAMYNWLVGSGIAPARILKEEQATNTQENIQYSLELIADREGGEIPEPVAICSSEYHLYRAKTLLAEQGIEPLGVAGKTSYPILRLNYFIREGFAVAYLWCFGT